MHRNFKRCNIFSRSYATKSDNNAPKTNKSFFKIKERLGIEYLKKEWKSNLITSRFIREDIIAGTTLAFIALPLALAISVASGVSAQVGMISAITGGFVCALFGGTTLGVTGPAAAVCIMVSGIMAKFGASGILIVTLFAGILQFLTGFFKLGSLVRFVPIPVIEGFIAAIGGIIAITQLPIALGITIEKSPDDSLLTIISHILPKLSETSFSAAFLALTTISIIMILPHFIPKIKALAFPLSIAVCSFLNYALNLQLPALGAIPSTITLPTLHFTLSMFAELTIPILLMFAIISLESLLSSLATDKLMLERNKKIHEIPKDLNRPHNSNQELIGQGLGNIICGLIGGIPVTGVIVRSAANVSIGGVTRRSSIVHAISLGFIVFGASFILSYIPLCALGGILLSVSYNMMHPKNFKRVYSIQPSALFPMVVTFVSILLTDLTMGIEIGVAAKVLQWLYQRMPMLTYDVQEENHKLVVRLNGAINFLSKKRVDNIVRDVQGKLGSRKMVMLDFSGIHHLDLSGAEGIHHFFVALEEICPFSIVGCSEKIKEVILKIAPSTSARFVSSMV